MHWYLTNYIDTPRSLYCIFCSSPGFKAFQFLAVRFFCPNLQGRWHGRRKLSGACAKLSLASRSVLTPDRLPSARHLTSARQVPTAQLDFCLSATSSFPPSTLASFSRRTVPRRDKLADGEITRDLISGTHHSFYEPVFDHPLPLQLLLPSKSLSAHERKNMIPRA